MPHLDNTMISILMPVKDTAQYLKECVDSIISQTEYNWELIAVNDNSTDQSNELLNEYALKDDRIRVYQNTGNGIIDAIRLAFKNAKGDLITRMDSDDIMHIDKLKVLKNNLIKSGEGNIATGLVKYFSEKELGNGFQNYEKWLNSLIQKGSNFTEIYKECVIPSPCWMVFRTDLIKCEAFTPNVYPEDYDLTFRFYINGLAPIPCNQVLHYWRDYTTRTSRTHEHYSDNTFLALKIDYFLKHDYNLNKQLIVWGAGAKGKSLAKKLILLGIDFHWICDNPKKIGKHIYEKLMLPFNSLETLSNTQSIITVANPKEQEIIKSYFSRRNDLPMIDYFFFC